MWLYTASWTCTYKTVQHTPTCFWITCFRAYWFEDPRSSGYTVGWLSIWVSRTISKLPGLRNTDYDTGYWKFKLVKGEDVIYQPFHCIPPIVIHSCWSYILVFLMNTQKIVPKTWNCISKRRTLDKSREKRFIVPLY